MILDFLKTKRSIEDLRAALEVLREFKSSHSMLEDLAASFVHWVKLEQLEEFLDHRVNGTPLNEDTLAYVKKMTPPTEESKT